jgi:AraC family transcriptional activator of pobA
MTLPLFQPYGEPPHRQAFDFIHVETIASRARIHAWTIRAHRHRNLFQVILIDQGGGEMTYEAASRIIEAPCAILLPAAVAHGFRFRPAVTEGWVISFSEDVARTMGEAEALAGLKALAADPVVPLGEFDRDRLVRLAAELQEESSLARAGYRIAMHGLLALVAVGVARLAGVRDARASAEPAALASSRATLDALRKLLEEHFHEQRHLAFYAKALSMRVARLNDHVRRAAGVTAGHLIRQRTLAEAKRQLVFTTQPIHEIAYALAFFDPSHFARFFRQQTGTTPHEFRSGGGT